MLGYTVAGGFRKPSPAPARHGRDGLRATVSGSDATDDNVEDPTAPRRKWYLSAVYRGHRRTILTGAIYTRVRLFKGETRATPLYPYCGENQKEMVEHLLWEYSAWRVLREEYLAAMRFDMRCCSRLS